MPGTLGSDGLVSNEWDICHQQINLPFQENASAMTMIKEADYNGSDETRHTCNGRRGNGDGRSAAPFSSTDWARRSCNVFV